MGKYKPRLHVRSRYRVVSLSVCPPFLPVQSSHAGPLKLTFSSGKVALVNKPVFLCSTNRSEHSEAQKASFLTFRLCLNRAFFFDDHAFLTFLETTTGEPLTVDTPEIRTSSI